jgi:DNA-binding NarL/FixJ family response regulator
MSTSGRLSLASSGDSLGEQSKDASSEDRLRLLESAERLANLGGWEWFPGSDRMFWSANLYRIFGVEPDEITPSLEFVLSRTHPDDRDRVERHAELILSEPCPPAIEYRINPPGRGVRYLRSTTTATHWDDRGPRRIAGAVQDVTDQLLDNRELAAHVAVSRALAEWHAFEESGKRLLRSLAEALQFVFAALWLPDGGLLKSRLEWSDSSLDASAFAAATQALCFARGVGFLGRAWEGKTPVNVVDVLAEPNYRRRELAAQAGLRGAAAFPVLHEGEVLAVLELYKQEEHRPTPRATQTMIAISNELGQFLSRRQGQLLDLSPLTPRELQVLQLAADGFSRSQIAARLTVSSATIATHMKHIFESLGVRDRASAVATAIRLGLIE